jgi:hypothetical protein
VTHYDEASMYREIESHVRVWRLPGTMSRVDCLVLGDDGEIAAVAEMKARTGEGRRFPYHWVSVTKRTSLSYVAAGLSRGERRMTVRPLFIWGYDDGIVWTDTADSYYCEEATTGRKDWQTPNATERMVLVPSDRVRPLHDLPQWLRDTE